MTQSSIACSTTLYYMCTGNVDVKVCVRTCMRAHVCVNVPLACTQTRGIDCH